MSRLVTANAVPGAVAPEPFVAALTSAAATSPTAEKSQAARLQNVLAAVAPSVAGAVWVPALCAAFTKFDVNSDRRIAAALGQFLVEAGKALRDVTEDLDYTNASRLVAVFPDQFPTEAAAQPYVRDPKALGNFVYTNRLGNGDVASGDGFRFQGRGLIQITGRDAYAEFGASVGLSAEQAAAYCETTLGAAMSGCWYLAANACLPLADMWEISRITRRVNGPAMLANDERIAYSNAAYHSLCGVGTDPGTMKSAGETGSVPARS